MKPQRYSNTFAVIKLRRLLPDPARPRLYFDLSEDEALVESIKKFGILTSLIVAPNGDGTYTIVDGYLRYEASRRSGLKELPCLVTAPLTSREIGQLRWDLYTTFLPLTKQEREGQLRRIREITTTALAA